MPLQSYLCALPASPRVRVWRDGQAQHRDAPPCQTALRPVRPSEHQHVLAMPRGGILRGGLPEEGMVHAQAGLLVLQVSECVSV